MLNTPGEYREFYESVFQEPLVPVKGPIANFPCGQRVLDVINDPEYNKVDPEALELAYFLCKSKGT